MEYLGGVYKVTDANGVQYNCDVYAHGGYGVPRAACCDCNAADPLSATRSSMYRPGSAYHCYYSCHVCEHASPSAPPPAPPLPPHVPGTICTNTCDDPGHNEWGFNGNINPHSYDYGHLAEVEGHTEDGVCQDGGDGGGGSVGGGVLGLVRSQAWQS